MVHFDAVLWVAILASTPVLFHVETATSGPTPQERAVLEALRPGLEELGLGPVDIEFSSRRCDSSCADALNIRAAPGEAYLLSLFGAVRRIRLDIVRARDPTKLWRVIEGAPGSEAWSASLREAFASPTLATSSLPASPPPPPANVRPEVWWLSGGAAACGLLSVVAAAAYAGDQGQVRGPIYDGGAIAADDRRKVTGPLALGLLGAAAGMAVAAALLGMD